MSASKIVQAFVLAAGLGKRLRPLTDDLPKPLIPIFHKPLITFALDHLIELGVCRFVVNTHKLPELFKNFFGENGYAGCSVTLVHEPELLETGGGIKNVEPNLGSEPFITYSGDILTDINLQPLIEEHFIRRNDVTLALRETGLATDVAFRDHRVADIANRHGIRGNFDFANVAVWNSEIFQRIAPQQKISFVPVLADWIREGARVGGLVINEEKWFNISSRAEYLNVHRMILQEHWRPDYVKIREWPERVAKTALVHPTAQLRGCTTVARDCCVGAEVIMEDTILWPGSEIASKSRLESCIVRSRKKTSGFHRNIDI